MLPSGLARSHTDLIGVVIAVDVVDCIAGLHGKAALIVVAHLVGHGGVDAAVVADALAGQEEAADDHGDLCARGRAIGVKIPAVFAGEDARGVHSLHRLAELRIHGVQIRDGLVVDRGQILCAQHIRKQARQLLPGDGLRRDGTSVRARGGQELRFRGIGDIWLVPRAAGLGDLTVVAGGVDAHGNGNGLCPETVCFGEKLVFPVPFMIPRRETACTPAAYQLPDGTSENAPGCAFCGF